MSRRSSISATFLLALAPMLVAAADEASPRAVPVEAVADLGVVPRAETVLHSFEIRNDGSGDLELTDVRPACGCISVDFDRSIAPGEVGVINIRLDTSRLWGPIEESIAVYTNDKASPKLQLVTKARVEAVLVAEPGFARFLDVQQEPTRPVTQLIWAQDGTDFDILDVRSPYPYVLVEVRMADAGERAADHPESSGRSSSASTRTPRWAAWPAISKSSPTTLPSSGF